MRCFRRLHGCHLTNDPNRSRQKYIDPPSTMWNHLIRNIKDFFLRRFLGAIYQKYASRGWVICCNPPEVFNVAMPDLSVCYFVASFKTEDDFLLTGRKPPSTIYRYMSFTVYDTNGLPFDQKHDADVFTTSSSYKIGTRPGPDVVQMRKPTQGRYYCLVLRWYRSHGVTSIEQLRLPSMQVQGVQIKPASYDEIHRNSMDMTNQFISIVRRRHLHPLNDCGSFLYPYFAGLHGLFPNKDASYMIVSLGKTISNGVIEGKIPKSDIGNRKAIRFVGLMVCNYITTETDSSVSDEVLPSSYRIFVSTSMGDAIQHGYKEAEYDYLLLISPTNQHPVIIYREVRVDGQGLHQMTSNRVEEAKRLLGDSYPVFRCISS